MAASMSRIYADGQSKTADSEEDNIESNIAVKSKTDITDTPDSPQYEMAVLKPLSPQDEIEDEAEDENDVRSAAKSDEAAEPIVNSPHISHLEF